MLRCFLLLAALTAFSTKTAVGQALPPNGPPWPVKGWALYTPPDAPGYAFDSVSISNFGGELYPATAHTDEVIASNGLMIGRIHVRASYDGGISLWNDSIAPTADLIVLPGGHEEGEIWHGRTSDPDWEHNLIVDYQKMKQWQARFGLDYDYFDPYMGQWQNEICHCNHPPIWTFGMKQLFRVVLTPIP